MTRRIGIAILVLVVLVVVGYQVLGRRGGAGGGSGLLGPAPGKDAVTVKGYLGGEKVGLMKDPEIQRLLRDRAGVMVDGARAGSIDMVKGGTEGQDFLWPSSQIALEIYKDKGGKFSRAEILFNSPMVLYAHRPVTDALVKAGIVEKVQDAYYIVDFPKLTKLVLEKKQWKEVGLPQLYGRVNITCTDPTRSNSGNMFSGLLANLLNNGEVTDEAALPRVLPDVKQFFSRLGYMQGSSGELFSQFLQQGMGSYPLIVGYEAQLIEFGTENQQYREVLGKQVNCLYPRPTVWSSHPLIALTPAGEKLLIALQLPEVQKLAWERHGFRSGVVGVMNDPKALQVTGVPATIENVMPMPNARVMERIIQGLSGTQSGQSPDASGITVSPETS